MEHQAGPSGLGRTADKKLALTEENLDYLLRQEYTLSQMCYDADQMTLEVINEMNRPQNSLKNPNYSNDEQRKQQNISVEKMVVGQDDDSDFTLPKGPLDENEEDKNMDLALPKGSIDENNEDKNVNMEFALPKGPVDETGVRNINMGSLKDIFKLDVDAPGLISLYNFCQTEYGENADYMWKENLQEVWQAKKAMDEKLSASASAQEDSEDVAMDMGKVSREPVCFEINNINDPISTDNSIPLNVNYCINSKIQIDNWKNVSVIKYFVNDDEMEIPKESPNFASKNSETYQVQSSSVPSTQLKQLGGLSTASTHTTSTQNDGLFVKKNTNDISSVRDLALASCSSHDIEYIDADEDCFESPTSEVTFYKTDSEDSKKNKTLSSINKTRGNMIDLEDLLNTFTESTNLQIRNLNFENVVPAKSSLKRKISQISNKKNVKMSQLKFTNVTIFYFERSQGFSSIPTKGGSTLGMENQHFYISTIPIDEYEHRKVQKQHSNLRSSSIICHRKSDSREKPKNVQALSLSQRIELLESAEVQIERKEEVDCAHIRSSRASAGCDCKEYCDPEVCCCSLAGIECQVDRPNFPCGCSKENCRNRMGRNEYNHSQVKTHFTKTMRKINYENKGRTSKRKQASPTKVIMRNPDITRDINMIQI